MLLITYLLSENIKSNVRIMSVPANSKLENLVPHFLKLPENNFSNIDMCFIAIGHNDLDTMVEQFMTLYKAMIVALQNHKMGMLIYVISVLPLRPRPDLY